MSHEPTDPKAHPSTIGGADIPPILPPPVPRTAKRSGFRLLALMIVLMSGVGLVFLFRGNEPTKSKPIPVTVQKAKSDAGVSYRNERVERVPWSVHIVKVDRARKDLVFYAALARGKVLGVSMIADQVRSVPPQIGRAVAGINADFYERDNPTYAGDPRGLQIVDGELVSGPSTVCVWFDADGNPHMDEAKGAFKVTLPDGRKIPFGLNQQRQSDMVVLYTPTYGSSTRVTGGRNIILERVGSTPWLPLQAGQSYRAQVLDVLESADTRLSADTLVLSFGPQVAATLPKLAPGTVLEISTATTPDLRGVKTAIAGGPVLVKNGKPSIPRRAPPGSPGTYSERSKYDRHPRSAIGWNATHIYLVTVDGRQRGLSVGMTLAELGEYMVRLGCTDGMNFDGGKSAQIWMSGSIKNNPCQGVDTVANSLLVVRKPVDPQ